MDPDLSLVLGLLLAGLAIPGFFAAIADRRVRLEDGHIVHDSG